MQELTPSPYQKKPGQVATLPAARLCLFLPLAQIRYGGPLTPRWVLDPDYPPRTLHLPDLLDGIDLHGEEHYAPSPSAAATIALLATVAAILALHPSRA